MFLICGLGNPGKKYINTRHNIGFNLIDKISAVYNFSKFKKDSKKEVFRGFINNNPCILMKPLNFMNLSGKPIQEIMNYYKIEKNKIYVIHDDIDLQLGKIKVKLGGGNGGHNGLFSIDEKIGNDYYRLRIGIDHPGIKDMVSDYVLKKFNKDEKNILEKKLDKITENFGILFENSSLFLTKLAEEK
tara:strand:- start:41 stop:601 length:561 start_codon:yes stop_codon:yes gene_type:complete